MSKSELNRLAIQRADAQSRAEGANLTEMKEPIAQGSVDVNVRLRPPVADRYAEAVKLPNGSIENFMPRVGGKSFRCSCGCNVFHKPDRKHPEIYECNGCEARYEGA